LVDVLNITEKVIETFKKLKTNKILVINKVDTFPKSLRKESVINHLRNYYKIEDKIIFASAIKGYGIKEIKNIILENNYTYLVGYTNSGKSSLINRLKKEMGNNEVITTSIIPNTTIDFIKIKLDNNYIIDSPGFMYDSSIYNNDNLNLIKKTNIKNRINPITYQIKENDKVLIEDFMEISVDSRNSFTFYMSNNLKVKKIYKEYLCDLNSKIYEIKENQDLIIKGLGFINIKKPSKLKIFIEDQNLIEIRDSIIGK